MGWGRDHRGRKLGDREQPMEKLKGDGEEGGWSDKVRMQKERECRKKEDAGRKRMHKERGCRKKGDAERRDAGRKAANESRLQ